ELILSFIHADDRASFRDHLERLRHASDDVTAEHEFRARHADGTWRWLSLRWKVLRRDADGTVRHIMGIARDITRLITARQELQRLNSELERRVAERSAQLERTAKELRILANSLPFGVAIV